MLAGVQYRLGLRASGWGVSRRSHACVAVRRVARHGAAYERTPASSIARYRHKTLALMEPVAGEQGRMLGEQVETEMMMRKEEKRRRKEARKEFERENRGKGKLWLLHWHQSSLPAASQLEGVISCYREDLKRLEKVSKDSVWFTSHETETGHHIFLVTAKPKTAFKYNLVELPSFKEVHNVPLASGAGVEIPVSALREQLMEREKSNMAAKLGGSTDNKSSMGMGEAGVVAGAVPPKAERKVEKMKDKTLRKVEKMKEKEWKKEGKLNRLMTADLDSVMVQLEDIDTFTSEHAMRLIGMKPGSEAGTGALPLTALGHGAALKTMSDDRDISNILMLSAESDTEGIPTPAVYCEPPGTKIEVKEKVTMSLGESSTGSDQE